MSAKWDNKEEMKQMQQDAIRRVQEMQSKAKEKIAQASPPLNIKNPEDSPQVKNDLHRDKSRLRFRLKKGFKNSKDIIQSITQDSERNLILMIILLLMEEETDTGLLLSLMYLII